MNTRTTNLRKIEGRQQAGFTLIEVMISIVVLTVGLLSLLATVGVGIAATQTTKADFTAKQLAEQAVESIYTARDTANIQWQQIQNSGTGEVPDGIFVPGFNPVLQAGPDGIFGTADDTGAQVIESPGPDGIYGTADDIKSSLKGYTRKILIQNTDPKGTNLGSNLRWLEITVQYSVAQSKSPKQYVLQGYISSYR
ncbi:MAG TPA: prepilin-type N-terminal cleavage/methylation domain-containing protein [Terriglobales bacterium]|jgi:prepilin-type N-terminal cleavage/methylation domain-containing protein